MPTLQIVLCSSNSKAEHLLVVEHIEEHCRRDLLITENILIYFHQWLNIFQLLMHHIQTLIDGWQPAAEGSGYIISYSGWWWDLCMSLVNYIPMLGHLSSGPGYVSWKLHSHAGTSVFGPEYVSWKPHPYVRTSILIWKKYIFWMIERGYKPRT